MAVEPASSRRGRGRLRRRRRREKPTGWRAVLEWVVTIAVAVGVAYGIQALLVKPYRIPSPSMEPTLTIGQRVLVHRVGVDAEVGDIIVFNPPRGADAGVCTAAGEGGYKPTPCSQPGRGPSDSTYIKRVVGVGGDHITIRDGHVYRNGKRESDDYIRQCGGGPECNYKHSIVVPKGTVYVMGDNRGESDDSRFWGPVPRDWIIGEMFFTYWPLDRIGF